LAALCLSACGGEAKRAAPPPPSLPRVLAATLAARSDAVAAALAQGDGCRARMAAQQLQHETIAAINAGRIAAPLQEELSGAVNDLAARVTCVPPPAATSDEDEHPKHKGKGHEKKKHGEDD
jgi:hypothetical protein